MPTYPAISTATKIDSRADNNSCFSVIEGMKVRLSMSCATEVEITSNNPAAVDRAAARAPAVTSATTQFGRPAISGLAITIMSALTVSSLRSGSPRY